MNETFRGPALALGLGLALAMLLPGAGAQEAAETPSAPEREMTVAERMQAALAAEKALHEASPDDPAINARLGMAYVQFGDHERGLELMRRAVELAPDEPRYLYRLGRGLYGSQAYDEVLETMDRVLGHPVCDDRLAAEALVLSGTVRLRRKEFAGADADFLRAVARDETYAPAHMNMGIRLMQAGDSPGAERELVRAAELAPTDPKALSTLAQLYERTGKQTTAFLYWQRVAVLVPDDYRVQMMVAGHYISQKEDSTARPYLERAIELQPAMAEPHLEMAELLTRQKEYERAWEEAQKAKVLGLENELLLRRLEIIRSGQPDPYLEMEKIPADRVSPSPRESESEPEEKG